MNPLPELEQELQGTRKALERVPQDKPDYKPHPKSGTLMWLAGHVADIVGWGAYTLQTETLEFAGMEPPPTPKTSAELLERFENNARQLREALASADEAALSQTWTATMNGQVVMSMPRAAVLRSVIMNHLIHHRAQLTVYLRLLDIPVPALYGPSADEGQGFGDQTAAAS